MELDERTVVKVAGDASWTADVHDAGDELTLVSVAVKSTQIREALLESGVSAEAVAGIPDEFTLHFFKDGQFALFRIGRTGYKHIT